MDKASFAIALLALLIAVVAVMRRPRAETRIYDDLNQMLPTDAWLRGTRDGEPWRSESRPVRWRCAAPNVAEADIPDYLVPQGVIVTSIEVFPGLVEPLQGGDGDFTRSSGVFTAHYRLTFKKGKSALAD